MLRPLWVTSRAEGEWPPFDSVCSLERARSSGRLCAYMNGVSLSSSRRGRGYGRLYLICEEHCHF